ncbi:hypothetical protein N7476_011440 [Penicillium atrosanguineum]|uniref:DUF924 domain-containing protein n=1 Tax=Penicillium atrosanguineum TaxID=1132637 RepID=A0A9W9U014_9EURO|nr:hypothetical protein N7526_010725 [Penicillium atrosanguineum]KAJ5299883.1 hypothetical protein N7476_011440 [Penicillium atrosanguineum]
MRQVVPIKPYQDVLDFWFGRKSARDYLKEKSFWYASPTDDAYVRKSLGESYEEAKNGSLDEWMREGEGALALILLLDQVPRNIFRGTPQAYATDSKAVTVARYAIERKWDKELPNIQRRYMYSPFNHSEDLKDQEYSVKLFTELGDSYHLHWAKDFRDQIERNGRFTHRDSILGRS